MREFDTSCLAVTPEISAADIKRIREQAHVSQPVFARYLNTSESTVQTWEAGGSLVARYGVAASQRLALLRVARRIDR